MKWIIRIFDSRTPAGEWLHGSLLGFRVLVAFSMIHTHGLKKILDMQGTIEHIPDPFHIGGEASTFIAISANIFFALFVALGFATRVSALFILSVTLSGFFIVHAGDPWSVRDVPLMYSISFLMITISGPGNYSLDHLISKKIKRHK